MARVFNSVKKEKQKQPTSKKDQTSFSSPSLIICFSAKRVRSSHRSIECRPRHLRRRRAPPWRRCAASWLNQGLCRNHLCLRSFEVLECWRRRGDGAARAGWLRRRRRQRQRRRLCHCRLQRRQRQKLAAGVPRSPPFPRLEPASPGEDTSPPRPRPSPLRSSAMTTATAAAEARRAAVGTGVGGAEGEEAEEAGGEALQTPRPRCSASCFPSSFDGGTSPQRRPRRRLRLWLQIPKQGSDYSSISISSISISSRGRSERFRRLRPRPLLLRRRRRPPPPPPPPRRTHPSRRRSPERPPTGRSSAP